MLKSILCVNPWEIIFFEGITTKIFDHKPYLLKTLGHLIMTGADTNADALAKGNILSKISEIAEKVLVYVNTEDKLLTISRFLWRRQRLGIDGLKDIVIAHSEKVEIINTTHTISHQYGLGTFIRHYDFKDNPTVTQDIELALGIEKKVNPKRKLINEQKYVLIEAD